MTLTLERLSDGLHLSEDLPGFPFPSQGNTSAHHDTGFVEIQRSENVSIDFRVRIEFDSQTSHVIKRVIMTKGEREARIELKSGDYILWARVKGTRTGIGEETTNLINLTISRTKTVRVRIEIDRILGELLHGS